VTYGIVQEHCGTIEVESPVLDPKTQKPKPGTAFHLRFPATEKYTVNDEENQ